MSFIDTPEFDASATRKDGAVPLFSVEAVKNNFLSEKEGRPVFDNVEMVKILIPGDRKSEWSGRVTEEHRRRFAREYEAFKRNEEAPIEGTPVAQLPGILRNQVEELRFQHVLSIEQLANLSDDQLSKVAPMYGRVLRERAQRWLEAVTGNAPTEKLAAENRQLQETMAAMKAQMDAMQAQMEAMKAGVLTPTDTAPPSVEG